MIRRSVISPIFCFTALGFGTLGLWDPSNAAAQAVQLPSFSNFSYSGTVVVPDSGRTSLGGVNRSAMGSSRRWGSRATGQSLSNSNASITATIIDLDAMDRRIRGIDNQGAIATAGQQGATIRAAGKSYDAKIDQRSKSNRDPRVVQDPDAEGKALVRYARAKLKSGDKKSAFEGYRLAISVLSPYLRNLAIKEFRRAFPIAAAQVGAIPR